MTTQPITQPMFPNKNRFEIPTKGKLAIAGVAGVLACIGIVFAQLPNATEKAILESYKVESQAKLVWTQANQQHLAAVKIMDQAKSQAEQARQNRAMIESNQLFIQPQQ